MVPRFATSILRTGYSFAQQWWLQIESWRALAARSEFQNASLAIVGNAGYLAELDQGAKIDGHDLVLRMNNFQTAGFESCVGKRTDIFLTTFHHDVCLTNPGIQQAKMIVTSVPNNLRRDRGQGVLQRHGVQIAAGLGTLQRRQAYVPDWNYFLQHKQSIGKYPTSGAMAILLATEFLSRVCQSIYLTGFSFFRGRSHYFTDEQITPRNHDVDREEHLICELLRPYIAAGKITLDERMAKQWEARDERKALTPES